MKKAEITAFLSLIFILLVTFTGSILEATSLEISKNLRRADAVRAMECIFAEYQKELLEEYDVFAFDAGYEGGIYSEDMITERLEYYDFVNSDSKIERVEFLTDHGARGFQEQVSRYMEHKYGLDYIKEELGMTDFWEDQKEVIKDYKKEDFENLFPETDGETSIEDESLLHLNELVKTPLLELVLPENKRVSEKKLPVEDLPSKRKLNEGHGSFTDEEEELTIVDRLLFGEYILEHFSSAIDETGNVIDYEIEYIIAGKESDRENLRSVMNQLMAIRFVPNYAFLKGSAEKRIEAQALALTLSTVMAMPAAVEAFTQGILLVWAFGESVVDIRALLNGKSVPLAKKDSNWQLSISGLLKLGDKGDAYDGTHSESGLDYKDYLRMLLFLEKRVNIAVRSLDLVEENLRQIHGLTFFRTDLCVTKMEIESECMFRRGITYTFPTYFGYQ